MRYHIQTTTSCGESDNTAQHVVVSAAVGLHVRYHADRPPDASLEILPWFTAGADAPVEFDGASDLCLKRLERGVEVLADRADAAVLAPCLQGEPECPDGDHRRHAEAGSPVLLRPDLEHRRE
jgi:hypothetical protein